MSAFYALLGFDILVVVIGACLTASGNYSHTLRRGQAKPRQDTK